MSNGSERAQAATGKRGQPPTMSLRDLPAPSFKAAPHGQRSVPALEKPDLFGSSSDTGQPPQAGPLTPGAGGLLGMGREPWNLFGHPEEAAKAPAWKDASPVGAADKPEALQRPVATLARSTSYNGESGRLRDAAKGKPALQRADTQSHLASPATNDTASTTTTTATTGATQDHEATNGKTAADLSASFANLGLDSTPSAAGPHAGRQQPWIEGPAKPAYQADPSGLPGFYNTGNGVDPAPPGFAAVAPSVEPTYDIFRRDSGYGSALDFAAAHQHPQGNARRVQSAWQMPLPDSQPQRRSPMTTRYPSSNMSRNTSNSSLYGLGGGGGGASSMRSPDPLVYQPPLGGGQQYYGGLSVFSPQAPQQPRGLPSPMQSYGRGGGQGYDAAGPMVDYAAYGGNAFPSGLTAPAGASYPDYSQGMPGAMRYEDRVRSIRSPLLEEFRANRHRRWDLSDIRGHIVEFSGDQLGSRHLQSKLDSATVEDKRLFFEEMMPNVLPLSADLFSNYVVQKAFEVADHNQKLSLVKALEGHVLQLSLQMYGCRVVQKALECVLVDEQVVLVNELKGNVLKCARDQNANHVLQRVLERVPADRIKFIPEACEGQVYSLATHPYGCRVLQRILENTSEIRPLIDELLKYTQNLMQDQYANYVVQHLLERGTRADRSSIIAGVRGQVVQLSKHKFASNVIDKVILCADDEERRALTDEILYDPTAVSNMLKDQFGNYCLQKFMLVVAGAQREILINRVADALLNIRKYSGTYSKHLLAIEKYIQNEQALAQYNAQMAAAQAAGTLDGVPLR